MAVHMQTVAVGWMVYDLTGDPWDLGLVGLAQFAPAFALFLVTGFVADRFERRNVIAVCCFFQILSTAALATLALNGDGTVWPVYALLVIVGAARAFYFPTSQALLPNMVPRRLFPNAVGYNSSFNKASQIGGPILSGLLIASIGYWVFAVVLCFFVVSLISVLFIRPRKNGAERRPTKIDLETVLGGFSYVWQNKVILGAISIDLFAVLFGGVVGMLPVFASDILHVGADGLGLLRAMPGVGALLTGILLSQIPAPPRLGWILFGSLAVFGASILVFSLSVTFWLSLTALAVYGAADMVSIYVRSALVQLATPDEMRGRVGAVNAVFINASNELGDFRAGGMAAFMGVVPAVALGGAVTLGVTAAWWWLFPDLRKVDRMANED
jgi:predicted MFS family arabinose efflux permease